MHTQSKTTPRPARMFLEALIYCLAAAAPASLAALAVPQPAMNVGAWQISQSINVGPDADQIQTRSICLTSDQREKDPMALFMPAPPPGRAALTCETHNLVVDGTQISYETHCAMPFGQMRTQWQGSYAADDFVLVGRGTMMRRLLVTKLSGRRIGDCPN